MSSDSGSLLQFLSDQMIEAFRGIVEIPSAAAFLLTPMSLECSMRIVNRERGHNEQHLILNTHWDREWRWSFRETQMRLIKAMDIVLDTMAVDERFWAFHTDAQVSMVDDYLELRPERRDEIKKRVKEGRLQTGPWYTLPAEFLVSGESLTRNLQMGHKLGAELGGVMKVAYNIFSWGQVSQLPQIYRQFGMETILFYRGVNQADLKTLEFLWEAPDGVDSLGVTFGAQHRINFWVFVYRPYIMGKGNGMDRAGGRGYLTNLCDPDSSDINHWMFDQVKVNDDSMLASGFEQLVATIKDKSSTNQHLFLQGFDLENPDPLICDIVDKINEQNPYGKLAVSTLPDYVRKLRSELEESGQINQLQRLSGEMLEVERQSGAFGQLFPGVWSARMPVKLYNAKCERILTRSAEPAAVWAMILGREYPVQQLHIAWKELLKNQQHDGIGGCHVDRIQNTMFERFRDVEDLGEAVTRLSLQQLVGRIDCMSLDERETGLVLFNPILRERSGVFEAVVDIPAEYMLADPVYGKKGNYVAPKELVLRDSAGCRIPVQILDQWEEQVYHYKVFAAHGNILMRRFRVLFQAKNVPSAGYDCYRASIKDRIDRPNETLAPATNVLENEYLRARINSNGTIDLLNKETGENITGLHSFIDDMERGNALMHVVTGALEAYHSESLHAQVVLEQAGPLMAAYRIELDWELPCELEAPLMIKPPQAGDWVENARPRRSLQKRVLKISSRVVLKKGSRRLEFKTTVDNTIRDHRLRLALPTGIAAVNSVADTPYDVVSRAVALPDASEWHEEALRHWPSSSFVDVSDGERGLAFLHKGIPEYELSSTQPGMLLVTLLRCFRAAGGDGETYREDKLSQCPGKQVFEYSLYLHRGDWEQGGVAAETDCFTAPMRIVQTTRHPGDMPFGPNSLVRLDNDAVVMTACKKEESGDRILLRGFNPTRSAQDITFTVGRPVQSAHRTNLEETEFEPVEIKDGHDLATSVRKGEIFTLVVQLEC